MSHVLLDTSTSCRYHEARSTKHEPPIEKPPTARHQPGFPSLCHDLFYHHDRDHVYQVPSIVFMWKALGRGDFHWAVPAVIGVSLFATLCAFSITACSDPGIVYHASDYR